MQCNIDARGKAVRLRIGLLNLAAATTLGALCLIGIFQSAWWWLLVAGTAAGGAFAVFEARAGWCAVRALGLKTPL